MCAPQDTPERGSDTHQVSGTPPPAHVGCVPPQVYMQDSLEYQPVTCAIVVNAAGAWAGELLEAAGLPEALCQPPLPIKPRKRWGGQDLGVYIVGFTSWHHRGTHLCSMGTVAVSQYPPSIPLQRGCSVFGGVLGRGSHIPALNALYLQGLVNPLVLLLGCPSNCHECCEPSMLSFPCTP